jgi:fucose 4-O-acetylase-like acetyltransferase
MASTNSSEKSISPFLSSKFRFWAFVSMFLLVFVHGYNLNERYLQPFTIVEEPMTITAFIEYFFANGILRFRIPMLFIISGYLFAMNDHQPYGKRTKKRLRTLLLPYLIWSGLALLMVYLMEEFTITKSWILSTGMMWIGENRMLLHDYHWYEVLGRWILVPVAYQLWFIRVLLIYNITYPWIKAAVTHKIARPIFFTIVILFWLTNLNFLIVEGEGLLYFSLGVWMRKKDFNVEAPKKWLNPVAWGIVFVSLCIIKTWLVFKGFTLMGEAVFYILLLLQKIAVFSGLVAAWYGLDFLVRFFMRSKWFTWAAAFSFIIYASHAPLVAFLIDPFFRIFDHWPYYRMITFILLPLFLVAVAIGLGGGLRRVTPKIYSILTGGRGL